MLKGYRNFILICLSSALAFAAGAFAISQMVDQYPQGTDGPRIVTGHERVVATSRAIVEIMDRLNVDVIGVPQTELEASDRFYGAVNIGGSMNPDMEIIRSLSSDWVFAPRTLESSLGPRFEAARIDVAFLNLRSIDHMYAAIDGLGPLLMRESEAAELEKDHQAFLSQTLEDFNFETPPRILILMGLPGSYMVATENSYIGSLVAMTGAINVYEGESGEFLTINTEDMLQRQPDIILRAAHALPDDIIEMFDKEFAENDIWRHFSAVQDGQVFDLPHDQFGMSANFEYTRALETLRSIYGQ
ncbi:MAG: heme ABC transporter substrate-binding protein IsdE [Coriobacteriia bacterium]|nr:heme ABC transporter substrate-binding protein IsdE [Coriobacteriia bacterium]MCL2536759.1 heme ABC transporter substrate-binding protein IsdE [Coriobacteriia bacterium]